MHIAAEHAEQALASIGLDASSLSRVHGLGVLEIAGRDSVAAAIVAVRERGLTTLLPTSVATGTEYGDEHAPDRAIAHLIEVLSGEAEVLPSLRLGSPRLWAALNGRFAQVIADRYRIWSPCLACHLYMHLIRLPLARAVGCAPIIAGERDSHGGRVKLSQTPSGIDTCVRILARGGVDLLEPIRRVHGAETVAELVGAGWAAGERQLCCVHSGNYADLRGEVSYDELAYTRYLHGFLEPVGAAVVAAWDNTPEPDYEDLVRGVLEGPDAA